jgi:FlaA1/EpsC-like NDP-sugar epimerase
MRWLAALVQWLHLQNRAAKLFVVAFSDFVLLSVCVFLAYALRISAIGFPKFEVWPIYLVGPLLSIAAATIAGVYSAVLRNYAGDTESKIFFSQLLVPPVWAMILVATGTHGFARSVPIIYFLLALLVMIGLRRVVAALLREKQIAVPRTERIPVMIYGAGVEGAALVASMRQSGRYLPVAFIDTDYTLTGRKVAGLSVYDTDNTPNLIARLRPRELMVAKPQLSRSNRRALVDRFISFGVQVKTIPNLKELVDGNFDLSALQPIKLEDLLGRDPVPPDRVLMERAVSGRVVLVTGAGGSIGSELVRQIVGYGPRQIVILDHSEFALFQINREIEKWALDNGADIKIRAVLADILDAELMGLLFSEYNIDVVLHAAAYKHVRMVQENPTVAIANNTIGTKILAETASRNGVKLFVLISTDKAVRPTSIMGASKRVAEMVVQGLAGKPGNKTVFAIVRFGNVLGSTGSVVPIFKEQIERGGPVTVTHREVTRYFMLIPEAAQLVIQAGAMAEGGDVFVLDMGDSVKIVDLAITMIELAGLSVKSEANPSGDVEIRYSGLLPGEKLYEELQMGSNVSSTNHQRIMQAKEFCLSWKDISREIKPLQENLLAQRQEEAVAQIFKLAQMN